jgi:hypothetical protein
MQVISDMLASQRTMSQSLAQVANRLAMVGIPGTQTPHATQGNSGAESRPQTPTHTYTSSSRIPRPWLPSFQRAPPVVAQQSLAHRLPTQAEYFAEYKREYVALGPDFHHDMTLVEYYVLHIKNTHFDSVASVVITKVASVAFCSQGRKCHMLLTSVASVKESMLP